jgi:hypothetical protein
MLFECSIIFVLVRLQANHLIHPAAQEKPDSALSCYLPYAFLLLPRPGLSACLSPFWWLSLSKPPEGRVAKAGNGALKKQNYASFNGGESTSPGPYSK